jgi:hypothetical protein
VGVFGKTGCRPAELTGHKLLRHVPLKHVGQGDMEKAIGCSKVFRKKINPAVGDRHGFPAEFGPSLQRQRDYAGPEIWSEEIRE